MRSLRFARRAVRTRTRLHTDGHTRPLIRNAKVLGLVRWCSVVIQACAAASDQQSSTTEQATEEYDVYVAGPQPLDEGIEKHTISVFVADESGIINRVAGVFARRGMNIESLAVGLNIDKALFTITVNGKPTAVANIMKQLSKLVKVRYVENITDARLERELALFKIGVRFGASRSEVLELTQIFGGRIVDVGPAAVTIVMSGDAGKLFAFETAVRPFGLQQLARTGRIALRKSDSHLDMAMAAFSPGRRAELTAHRDPQRTAAPVPASSGSADVYVVSSGMPDGPWNVGNVLEPGFEVPPGFRPHTLIIEVDDIPGVLNEVTGVIARRGYNVQSLAVGNSERKGSSRIVTVIPGREKDIPKLIKQLEKLIVVREIQDLSAVPHVQRELMLVKVRCSPAQRAEIKALVEIFGGSIAHVTDHSLTVELIGKEQTMQEMQSLLEPYGVLEVARTGRIALQRELGVNTEFLRKRQLGAHV